MLVLTYALLHIVSQFFELGFLILEKKAIHNFLMAPNTNDVDMATGTVNNNN